VSDWLPPEMRAAVDPLTDVQTVTLVLYGEARSEPIQGVLAVGNVLKHRVEAKSWFGQGWKGVALKPYQFSCLFPNGGKKNFDRVLALAQKLASGEAITDQKYLTCAWTARGILGGFLPDNVKACTHYHVAAMSPRPEWAQKAVPVAQHGSHVFYAGIK
jgi:N-acetylmuramoyl-L-alanine amidase